MHVSVCGYTDSNLDTCALVLSSFSAPRGNCDYMNLDGVSGRWRSGGWHDALQQVVMLVSVSSWNKLSTPWIIFLSSFSQAPPIIDLPRSFWSCRLSQLFLSLDTLWKSFLFSLLLQNGTCWLHGLLGLGLHSQLLSELTWDSSPQRCWLLNGVFKPQQLEEASNAKLFTDPTFLESELWM